MSRFFASSIAAALWLLAFGCSSKGATPSELGSLSGAPIDGEAAPILLAPLTSAGPFERPFSARPWNDDAKQMPDEVPLEDQAGVIIAAELIGDSQSPTPPRDAAADVFQETWSRVIASRDRYEVRAAIEQEREA